MENFFAGPVPKQCASDVHTLYTKAVMPKEHVHGSVKIFHITLFSATNVQHVRLGVSQSNIISCHRHSQSNVEELGHRLQIYSHICLPFYFLTFNNKIFQISTILRFFVNSSIKYELFCCENVVSTFGTFLNRVCLRDSLQALHRIAPDFDRPSQILTFYVIIWALAKFDD